MAFNRYFGKQECQFPDASNHKDYFGYINDVNVLQPFGLEKVQGIMRRPFLEQHENLWKDIRKNVHKTALARRDNLNKGIGHGVQVEAAKRNLWKPDVLNDLLRQLDSKYKCPAMQPVGPERQQEQTTNKISSAEDPKMCRKTNQFNAEVVNGKIVAKEEGDTITTHSRIRPRQGPCHFGHVTTSAKDARGRPIWNKVPKDMSFKGVPHDAILC